ncbi:hypothetical protein AX16_007891 [Volvariella volvacea WC 439]|nr:hypothetical protein AX16_007891 [Volvariella volvacea WC 439]
MVATLWMWLDKPSNVGYPLYFNRRGDRITSPSIPSQGWGILGWLKSLFMTPAILLEMIWMEGLGDHRQLNFGSTWFKVAFFLQCAYIFLLPGLAFCGFLISANSKKIITVWGFTYVAVPFPTQVLSSLWKLAAIIMVIGAYCLWIILLVPSSNAAKHGTRRLACYVVILAFIAARLTILVLSFMSLSNLPPGAFEVSPWVEWFPFIH